MGSSYKSLYNKLSAEYTKMAMEFMELHASYRRLTADNLALTETVDRLSSKALDQMEQLVNKLPDNPEIKPEIRDKSQTKPKAKKLASC